MPHPQVLHCLGVTAATAGAADTAALLELAADAPLGVAQITIFSHPEIGSVNKDASGNLFIKYLQD